MNDGHFDFTPTLKALEQRRDLVTAAIDSIHRVMLMYPADFPNAQPVAAKKPPYAKSEAKRLVVFWTPDRLDQLWNMRQRKCSVREIAAYFDVADQTIYNQITRLKKERGEDIPAAPAAEDIAKPPSSRLDKSNTFWTQARLDELWQMYSDGSKPKVIGRHFDKAPHIIYNLITRLKKERRASVEHPTPPPPPPPPAAASRPPVTPRTSAKRQNIIGGEGMTRQEVIRLLVQNAWNISVDEHSGEATLYGEVLTDEHLINLAAQYKKLPIVLMQDASP